LENAAVKWQALSALAQTGDGLPLMSLAEWYTVTLPSGVVQVAYPGPLPPYRPRLPGQSPQRGTKGLCALAATGQVLGQAYVSGLINWIAMTSSP
jgi:hypothetical protein